MWKSSLVFSQRLMDALLELCFPDADLPVAQTSIPFHDKNTRVALGIQPRGHVMGPLVPEFKGSKGIRRQLSEGGVILPSLEGTSEVHFHDMPDLRSCDASVSDQWKKTQLKVFLIGIPCSPEVFIERAFQVGHPRGFEVHMEPAVHEAINANFCRDPRPLAKLRIDFVKKVDTKG